jgi:8-oxo-dGTP pyrophosphatase MutT (NUDIX family)
VDAGESPRDTAIREFHEELGAAGHEIRLLGRLSPIYVNSSNFRIEPWVAAASARPPMVPHPAEVQELLEVPLAHLVDPANFGWHLRSHANDVSFRAPHFAWGAHRIWGATCMILGEFITILEDCGV